MTREEIKDFCDMKVQLEPENEDIFKAIVKELEQESVLDKVYAEIEEYKSRQLALAIGVADLEEGKQIALEYVLAIIDKYKAESENP